MAPAQRNWCDSDDFDDFDDFDDSDDSMAQCFGQLRIDPPSASASSPTRKPNDSRLLRLPNELLLRIVEYLAPTKRLLIEQGYGDRPYVSRYGVVREVAQETEQARWRHGAEVQSILFTSLTCKRLLPIAQVILYRDVSLPQPYCSQLLKTRAPSFLAPFLRTITHRPELGVRVRSLAVWFWHESPARIPKDYEKDRLCNCGSCEKNLGNIAELLQLSVEEKESFMKDFISPSEAAVCGLILAALPKLQTVELYTRRSFVESQNPKDRFWDLAFDLTPLKQGLSPARISSLALSTGFEGLGAIPFFTLTNLTLEYDRGTAFPTVHEGCCVNVNTLKVIVTRGDFSRGRRGRGMFAQNLLALMKSIPNLRILGVESGPTLNYYPILADVNTLAIHQADHDTLVSLDHYLKGKFAPLKDLRRLEVHWRGNLAPPDHIVANFPKMAKRAGIQIVTLADGEICEIFE